MVDQVEIVEILDDDEDSCVPTKEASKSIESMEDILVLDSTDLEKTVQNSLVTEETKDDIVENASEECRVPSPVLNDNLNTTLNTLVNLEATLPPGVAPEGFYVTDEDYSQTDNEESKPLLSITFRDDNLVRLYRTSIENFLKDLIVKSGKECQVKCVDLVLDVWAGKDKWTPDKDPGKETLFVVDTLPKIKDDLDIPTYGKKFAKTLDNSGIQMEEAKNDGPLKSRCFNCKGDHSLRDCTEPRNYNNIQKNRKEFNMKVGPRNSRYHLDAEQKFGHLLPGQISSSLRQALGLKHDELPRHIYKMRELGYPPGWMEEARLQHSGLMMYNSDGVAETEQGDEDGEVVCLDSKDKYDMKKLIDFSGFNVRSPRGTHDRQKQYWGSPEQVANSKTTLLSKLLEKKAEDGYTKKKLTFAIPALLESKVVPSEMDIDEEEEGLVKCSPVNGSFVPPLPKGDSVKTETPPTPALEESDNESMNESTAPSSRTDSPSLLDLEFVKKNILAELDDSSSISNVEAPGKSDALDVSLSNTEMLPPSNECTPINNRVQSNLNMSSSNRGCVKSMDLGTPILKSLSPYDKLPSSDKFSKDICDIICFENLPDSTGKYKQMSGLIDKVRNKLAEIRKE